MPILLNQRLCLRRQSLLANRLDSATPFCSLHPPQAALANVPDRVSGRQRKRTNLYEFGSSCTGAPSRLRSRSRGTSVTDAAYPLRVRALRRGCDRRFVGHDHWACRPRSGGQCRRTNLYAVGSSCTRRGDVCERRLWREERAKRSGRIKAIGERASHAMTEPLIQQNMPPPYRGSATDGC